MEKKILKSGKEDFMGHYRSLMKNNRDIEKLLNVREKTQDLQYDFALSNPPYQITTSNSTSMQVWPLLVESGNTIGKYATFIHPGRWINPKKSMIPIRNKMVELGLTKITLFTKQIFDNVDIDGGVTVTFFDSSQRKKNEKERNIILDTDTTNETKKWLSTDKFFMNNEELELYSLVEKHLKKTMDNYRIGNLGSLGSLVFGIHKDKFQEILSENKETLMRPVKTWANKSKGKGTRYGWYYLEREKAPGISEKLLTQYKVMIDKVGNANIAKKSNNIFNNLPIVLSSDEISLGNQFYLVPEENTKEECEIIASYMKTKFARALMHITQKDLYVRGLDNIPDYKSILPDLNKDGHNRFTDEWLYKYFNLPENLTQYVEEKISAK